MSDPLEELSRFGAGLEGGGMPLSAAEVRRRGDRIRRRRNALVAGGAAFAVAAVAVPVFALAGDGTPQSDRDRVATEPTAQTVTIGEDDLLTDAETEHIPEAVDWFATDTVEGDGQAPAHPCARSSYAGLGAEAVLQRNFEMRNLLPDADKVVVETASLNETIAEFPTAVEARAAYDSVAEWILTCPDGRFPDADRVNIVPQARSVDLPGGDAIIYDISWGPVPKELDPYGDEGFINETGIVLVDDRIAVITLTVTGQDYNFLPEDGGTPMERMIPPAAERLQD